MSEPYAESAFVRIRLDLAYDGTDFNGWASQPGLRTVQDTVESALALVLRADDVRLTVAGRTDAGVHARGQVCHTDVDAQALGRLGGPARLRDRLDRLLPHDVVVHAARLAPPGFDARFAALSRCYVYRIDDRAGHRDPLTRHHVLWWPRPLDEQAMDLASRPLVGKHDFAAFCKRREGASTVRALLEVSCTRASGVLRCEVVADAFCHHMVRALVGALTVVGEGRRPPTWPADVLTAAVRDPSVPVIPPHGLTLEQVRYPPDDDLAERAAATRTVRTKAWTGADE